MVRGRHKSGTSRFECVAAQRVVTRKSACQACSGAQARVDPGLMSRLIRICGEVGVETELVLPHREFFTRGQ